MYTDWKNLFKLPISLKASVNAAFFSNSWAIMCGQICVMVMYVPVNLGIIFREFLARNSISTLDHLPYLPAPCDFFLFMSGRHWDDVTTIKRKR